jgi:hypothetical protein
MQLVLLRRIPFSKPSFFPQSCLLSLDDEEHPRMLLGLEGTFDQIILTELSDLGYDSVWLLERVLLVSMPSS